MRAGLLKTHQELTRGFSLIELMVVFSVISVLVVMSLTLYKNHIIAAKRSGAKLNVRTLATLIESNYLENDFLSGVTGPTIIGYSQGGRVSENDFSSADSCHRSNQFGFSISDCRRTSYVYFGFMGWDQDARVQDVKVTAMEGSDTDGNKLLSATQCQVSPDIFVGNAQQLIHAYDPTKQCTCWFDEWAKHYSSPSFQWNFTGGNYVNLLDLGFIAEVFRDLPYTNCYVP